jgi:hypothetical protein
LGFEAKLLGVERDRRAGLIIRGKIAAVKANGHEGTFLKGSRMPCL